MLHSLSYSSLQLFAECRYSWFARYILGLQGQGTVKMHFGSAVDAALTASNEAYIESASFLEPSVVRAIFRDAFETDLPEYPGPLASTLDLFWLGEDPESMIDQGEDLIQQYYDIPWEGEDEDFLPISSAAEMRPEAAQLRLELKLPGDYVQTLVGVLDVLDANGACIDFKTGTKDRMWAAMDFDLQPTTYAALLGRATTFQYIELIRGQGRGKNHVTCYATVRTWDDVTAFLEYVQLTAREIDTCLKGMLLDLGEVDDWKEDPGAITRAAAYFTPSPGRRCAFDSHFSACHYRVGVSPDA